MSIPRPKIKTKFFDPRRKITFVVYAYRKVNRAEAETVFAHWRALNPRRKLLPGTVLEIETILGFEQPDPQ
jgi:hypothetical protein